LLTQAALQKIADFIDEQAVSGDYTIDGVIYPAELRRSIVDGTTVRKHIYLTQNDPYGTITSARLLDSEGGTFAERTDMQVHEEGKGLLLEFRFTVQEV